MAGNGHDALHTEQWNVLVGGRTHRYAPHAIWNRFRISIRSYELVFFREDDVLEHSSIVKIVFFMAFLRIIWFGYLFFVMIRPHCIKIDLPSCINDAFYYYATSSQLE